MLYLIWRHKKIRYHYISSNSLVFNNAIAITNRNDLERFLKLFLSRDDSSSTFASLTNLEIWVYDIKDTSIGRSPVNLPSYLKHSTSIIYLTHDGNKEIKDNICMFRCLALHFGGKRQGLERFAKSYKRQLEQATGLCFDKGVCISHIPDIDRILMLP